MFVFSSVVDPELFFPDPDLTSEKFGILTLFNKNYKKKDCVQNQAF
jgi:hypothetical protein